MYGWEKRPDEDRFLKKNVRFADHSNRPYRRLERRTVDGSTVWKDEGVTVRETVILKGGSSLRRRVWRRIIVGRGFRPSNARTKKKEKKKPRPLTTPQPRPVVRKSALTLITIIIFMKITHFKPSAVRVDVNRGCVVRKPVSVFTCIMHTVPTFLTTVEVPAPSVQVVRD